MTTQPRNLSPPVQAPGPAAQKVFQIPELVALIVEALADQDPRYRGHGEVLPEEPDSFRALWSVSQMWMEPVLNIVWEHRTPPKQLFRIMRDRRQYYANKIPHLHFYDAQDREVVFFGTRVYFPNARELVVEPGVASRGAVSKQPSPAEGSGLQAKPSVHLAWCHEPLPGGVSCHQTALWTAAAFGSGALASRTNT